MIEQFLQPDQIAEIGDFLDELVEEQLDPSEIESMVAWVLDELVDWRKMAPPLIGDVLEAIDGPLIMTFPTLIKILIRPFVKRLQAPEKVEARKKRRAERKAERQARREARRAERARRHEMRVEARRIRRIEDDES